MGQQTSDAAVSGQATAAAISASPSPLQFGGTALGMQIKKSVSFTNESEYEVNLTTRQMRWLKEAWNDDRTVAVDANASARCAGNIHVTDKTHYAI